MVIVYHGSTPNVSKDKDRPIVMTTYVPKGEYFYPGYNAQIKRDTSTLIYPFSLFAALIKPGTENLMTKVSILIPTMNRSEFIVRLIDYYISVNSKHPIYIGDASDKSIA